MPGLITLLIATAALCQTASVVLYRVDRRGNLFLRATALMLVSFVLDGTACSLTMHEHLKVERTILSADDEGWKQTSAPSAAP